MRISNTVACQESALGNKSFQTFNPLANKHLEGDIVEATIDEAARAVMLAQQDFFKYAAISGTQRALFLRTIADEMEQIRVAIVQRYTAETALPKARAEGELGRTQFQLRLYADLAENESWHQKRSDEANNLVKTQIPLGPVVVFGASNFPLAYSTAGGDTASALAVGCPVIVKGHPLHAGTGDLVSRAIVKAAHKTQMPTGVFSNLNSANIEIGQFLVSNPAIKAVGFTGSISGGRALYDLASARPEPIPVFAEMGSVNPVVLFPGKLHDDAQEIAKTLADSILLGVGQFCTSPGIIFGLEGSDFTHFSAAMAKALHQHTPSCMIHPDLHRAFEVKRQMFIHDLDAQLVMEHEGATAPQFASQTIMKTTAAKFISDQRLQEEVFGPFCLLVSCGSLPEMQKAIASLHGQLTGSIFANETELKSEKEFVQTITNRVGRLIFNGVPTGVAVSKAMQHGGPYPASTDSRFGAVGHDALARWTRPVAYQNFPESLKDILPNTKN